jgi:DNA polymerase-3 subunit delta
MGKPVAATTYLAAPAKYPPTAVCAVCGEETFLKREVLRRLRAAVLPGEDAELSYVSLDGESATWREVRDVLSTVAMFGEGRRLAVIAEADGFVSRHREDLEKYVAQPSLRGVLVLELKSFPANTRLYKAVAASGLIIQCAAPIGVPLIRWLCDWARQTYQVELLQPVAELLVERAGTELGILDQELAKLALSLGKSRRITPEMVERLVGSWRTRSVWDLLDAALDGNLTAAMRQLDRLLAAGEQPIAVLGQISASLRRFAVATRLVLQAESEGRRLGLSEALTAAGIPSFALQKSERQLRRLGRHRGAKLYRWLLEADLDLKGGSPLPPRLVLERFLLRLAAPPPPISR